MMYEWSYVAQFNITHFLTVYYLQSKYLIILGFMYLFLYLYFLSNIASVLYFTRKVWKILLSPYQSTIVPRSIRLAARNTCITPASTTSILCILGVSMFIATHSCPIVAEAVVGVNAVVSCLNNWISIINFKSNFKIYNEVKCSCFLCCVCGSWH